MIENGMVAAASGAVRTFNPAPRLDRFAPPEDGRDLNLTIDAEDEFLGNADLIGDFISALGMRSLGVKLQPLMPLTGDDLLDQLEAAHDGQLVPLLFWPAADVRAAAAREIRERYLKHYAQQIQERAAEMEADADLEPGEPMEMGE